MEETCPSDRVPETEPLAQTDDPDGRVAVPTTNSKVLELIGPTHIRAAYGLSTKSVPSQPFALSSRMATWPTFSLVVLITSFRTPQWPAVKITTASGRRAVKPRVQTSPLFRLLTRSPAMNGLVSERRVAPAAFGVSAASTIEIEAYSELERRAVEMSRALGVSRGADGPLLETIGLPHSIVEKRTAACITVQASDGTRL